MRLLGGRVEKVKRLRNTTSGNPRWVISLAGGTEVRTMPDAQIAHRVDDWMVGKRVTLHLTDGEMTGLSLSPDEEG